MQTILTGATQPMRDELARVLAYPQIIPRLDFYQLSADDVLAAFGRHARLVEVAPKASLTCSGRRRPEIH